MLDFWLRICVERLAASGHFLPALLAIGLLITATAPAVHAQTPDAQRRIRNVTPDNIPVIVLPPREQLPGDPRTEAFEIRGDSVSAVVSEDGTIVANGRTMRPVGLIFLPNDALCLSPTHGRWACGLRAYIARRNFVHGKELKCETIAKRPDAMLARCHRERSNVSEWLLAEGWAIYDSTAADAALSKAEEDARKNARGIWANGSQPLRQ